MYAKLEEDDRGLPRLMAAVAEYASCVNRGVDSRPVAVSPSERPCVEWPREGVGAAVAFERFRDSVAPLLSTSVGPRHLGFVTGGATPAALLGDWLASLFDQNPVSSLDGAAALHLERDTVSMLRRLFDLPDAFVGTFVTGATMSNFVGLAVAREWAGRALGVRVSEDGLSGLPPVTILSSTPHSSATKALAMLGMGRRSWSDVPCLASREAMDMGELERRLATHPGPCVVIASAGTVNTGDFDDFSALARLKQTFKFYLHIDAAFGGFASVSPALRPLLEGWTCADSISIDLHKWLNVPYDSAVAFTRRRDLQLDVFSNVSDYLGRDRNTPEPIHLAPENSHRWRALPAWFSLLAYGADGYREIVERDCRLARTLGERLRESLHFELLAPVRLNIVCFTLRNPENTSRFITAVRDGGQTFVTPTVLRGTPAIRAAFSNWRTSDADLVVVWNAFQKAVALCS